MILEKRLMVFLAILLILPILLLTIVTNKTGKMEQDKVLTNTLEAGLKVVRGEMLERKNGMRRVCNYFADSTLTQQAVVQNNRTYLTSRLAGLKRYFEYVDYVVVVDALNRPLAKLSDDMCYDSNNKLGRLVARAMSKRQVAFSEESFPLQDLFVPHSFDYDKFVVEKKQSTQEKSSSETNALTSLAVIPIYQGQDHNETIGAIIVCDVFNNDRGFPSYVSTYSNDAVVLASMDGVRVAANFATENGENLLGTKIAKIEVHRNTQALSPQYFSILKIHDMEYKVLNEEILDSCRKPVGLIGVGLPMRNYYTWTAASDYFIFFALGLYGLLLLAGWLYIKQHIAGPFAILSNKVRSYEEEHRAGEQVITNSCFEAEALEQGFARCITKIAVLEKEKEKYSKKYKEEFNRQTYLTNELRYLNGNLERQVEERTQYLGAVIEELQQANAVKTRFLANLSHELRTPLNIVMSSAEVLQDEIFGKLNVKQKNYAQGIYSSGSHLLSLINNLLSLSKLEFGKQTLQLTDFCLQDVIEEVIRNVRKFDPTKKLSITAAFTAGNILLIGDQQKLRQIIYNLMSNAVKFTPAGGKIEIKTNREGEMLRIVVEDNGAGIAQEDLSKVFQEFGQGKQGIATSYDGTGLGLPLVKRLVELQGGTVYLESEEGKGCKVTVFLPLNAREFLNKQQEKE